MRPGTPRNARALVELKAFRDAGFTIFSLGLFSTFVGLYFPFYYTSDSLTMFPFTCFQPSTPGQFLAALFQV